MHKNKFILISLVSSFSLFSCGAKISVSTENEAMGTVTHFVNNGQVVLQAFTKDNNLFSGWFIKNDEDKDYRFESALNPFIYKPTKNVNIQGRFEEYSSQTFNFSFNSDSFSIGRYHGDDTSTDVIIPNTHYGYPVTTIEANTFSNFRNLKSIKLSSNIKTINEDAFYECAVKELYMNSNLEICHDTFKNWTSSQTVYIPKSAIVREESGNPVTRWHWILTKVNDYYTCAYCGNSEPHIRLID